MRTPFSFPLRSELLSRFLPPYVERGGAQDLAGPFRLRDVAMDAFFFEADYGALVTLVDRDLNAVLRRADRSRPFGRVLPSVRVVPLAPVAMLVCAQAARIDAPGVGWVPEVDVGFWIPVLLLAKSGAARVPWKIAFYQPYLFVDSGQAMATGRESFGYHKMLGEFDLPADPAHPSRLEVRSLAWRTFGPESKAEVARVFELRETSGAPPSGSDFSSFDEAIRAALAEVADDGTELTVRAIDAGIDLLELLDLARVEQVFLKQLRSIEDPARACYQAVAKTGSVLRRFHRGGLLRGSFALELDDLASLPIRRDLGLGAGTLSPFASFWAVIDFDLVAGTTLGRVRT